MNFRRWSTLISLLGIIVSANYSRSIAQQSGTEMSVIGYGGPIRDVLTNVIIDPFVRETNTKVRYAPFSVWPTNVEEHDLVIADDRILQRLMDQGYLAPVELGTIPNSGGLVLVIPKLSKATSVPFVPIGYVATGIMVHSDFIKKKGVAPPSSWSDVYAATAFPMSVGVLDPSYVDGVSFLAATGVTRTGQVGESATAFHIMAGLEVTKEASGRKQFFRFTPGGLVVALGQGKVDVAAVGSDVAYRAIAEHKAPIKFIYPKEGAVLRTVGIGLVKKSMKAVIGKRLIGKFIEPTAQKQLVEKLHWGPAVEAVELDEFARGVLPDKSRIRGAIKLNWDDIDTKRGAWFPEAATVMK